MPRSIEEILANADDLARRFEEYEPRGGDGIDAAPVREFYSAVADRAAAEKRVTDGVIAVREAGLSWAYIGGILGTSGEAARQRYGRLVPKQ